MFGKKENKAPKPTKGEKKQAKLEKKDSKRELKEQKKQDKKDAKEAKKQEKKEQDALKPKTPSGEELSESIAAVLKDVSSRRVSFLCCMRAVTVTVKQWLICRVLVAAASIHSNVLTIPTFFASPFVFTVQGTCHH